MRAVQFGGGNIGRGFIGAVLEQAGYHVVYADVNQTVIDLINEKKEGAPFSHIKTCHICFIGLEKDNITQPMWHRQYYLFGNAPEHRDEVVFDKNEPDYLREYSSRGICEIMKTAREKGFFVTYNHPTWSLEDYSDYMQYTGMHAFEMFNGSCIKNGYEDYNPRVYDDMLRAGKRLYCIGADDNHNIAPDGSPRSDSGQAYTVIMADKLEYRTVAKALSDGRESLFLDYYLGYTMVYSDKLDKMVSKKDRKREDLSSLLCFIDWIADESKLHLLID